MRAGFGTGTRYALLVRYKGGSGGIVVGYEGTEGFVMIRIPDVLYSLEIVVRDGFVSVWASSLGPDRRPVLGWFSVAQSWFVEWRCVGRCFTVLSARRIDCRLLSILVSCGVILSKTKPWCRVGE